MAAEIQIQFSDDLVRYFAALSHDCNPLHMNAQYARRTPFGSIVVHGVAAVLKILGRHFGGEPFQLESISALFKKPLQVGISYDLTFTEENKRVHARVSRGAEVCLDLRFGYIPWRRGQDSRAWDVSGFHPLPAASECSWDSDIPGGSSRSYSLAPSELDGLERFFGLRASQLPLQQLSALCWSSYFVGMECPGRDALFLRLDCDFDTPAVSSPAIELRNLAVGRDARFRLVRIDGAGTDIRRFALQALHRPTMLSWPIADLRRELAAGPSWAGKNVFISGATRGFGLVLAKCLALRGANIATTFRHPGPEGDELISDLRTTGSHHRVLQADLENLAAFQQAASELTTGSGGFECVVHNAFPHIGQRAFADQSPDAMLEYMHSGVRLAVNALKTLVPLMKENGHVVHISSLFSVKPEPRFSHYAATKSAVEGLFRGVSVENPTLRFMNFRPPRMLTDQTNIPMVGFKTVSPAWVANRLIEALEGSDSPGIRELTIESMVD